MTVELLPSCDLAGSTEVSSDQPGARRYIRIDRDRHAGPGHPLLHLPGRLHHRAVRLRRSAPERLASEASSTFGFVTRDQLARDLDRRSAGRLQLDPP